MLQAFTGPLGCVLQMLLLVPCPAIDGIICTGHEGRGSLGDCTCCRTWRVSWRGGGQLWLTVRIRTLVADAPRNIYQLELSQDNYIPAAFFFLRALSIITCSVISTATSPSARAPCKATAPYTQFKMAAVGRMQRCCTGHSLTHCATQERPYPHHFHLSNFLAPFLCGS